MATTGPIEVTSGTSERVRTGRRGGRDHPGPPLGAPIITSTVLLIVGVFVGPLSGHGTTPPPSDGAAAVRAYFADAHSVTSLSAWLFTLSAIMLLIFTAIAYSRLTFLAPNAPGPAIAGVGGAAAALLLAVGSGFTWLLSRAPLLGGNGPATQLHYVDFVFGGPLHVASLGLLVAGMSVTTLFVARTPRALSLVGLAVALVDVVASTALLTDATVLLVPIGRFVSLAWLIAISLWLPRDRRARGTR